MTDNTYWPEKRRVVLLFGGRSSEHGISCVTAAGVLSAINRELFDVVPVAITRDGATVLMHEDDLNEYALHKNALPEVKDNGTRVLWPASTNTRSISVIDATGQIRSLGHVDVVLPMLHGPFGEDGSVQGMFELIDLPYVGSGVLGSALCMDKHAAKTVLSQAGITLAKWNTVTRSQLQANPSLVSTLDQGLSYPLFVKPNRAGSSVGVSKVLEPSQLEAAVTTALREDDLVLIEEGVSGREVEIAVLGGRGGDSPRTSSVIGEIVFTGREFYDFDAKYHGASGVHIELPASVTEPQFAAIREAAIHAFEVTQCAGLARIDFFLTDHGPVLNEINTLPGFTPISMYPQLWQHSGMSYTKLITELIELALEEHQKTPRTTIQHQ